MGLTWRLIVQRLRFLETSWSVARPASSRSTPHSTNHAMRAGRPSFGGQRISSAPHQPCFSLARILRTLAVRHRSLQQPIQRHPSSISFGKQLWVSRFCRQTLNQVKLTRAVLPGRRSNQVSLHVAVNARITRRSTGHFAAGRVWAIKS